MDDRARQRISLLVDNLSLECRLHDLVALELEVRADRLSCVHAMR